MARGPLGPVLKSTVQTKLGPFDPLDLARTNPEQILVVSSLESTTWQPLGPLTAVIASIVEQVDKPGGAETGGGGGAGGACGARAAKKVAEAETCVSMSAHDVTGDLPNLAIKLFTVYLDC